MKGLSIILSSLVLPGVIILFALQSSSCKNSGTAPATTNAVSAGATPVGGARIAYVDIDSFNAHYEWLKKKREEFKAQKADLDAKFQRSAGQFQSDYQDAQRKDQAGTMTKTEADATIKRLGQMKQSLDAQQESMSSQFQEKVDAFETELRRRLDDYLSEYAKKHQLDYVLSYSHATPVILYGNKSLDITLDVIKDMNARATSDTKSK